MANVLQLGPSHLQEKVDYEVQRPYNFELHITGLPTGEGKDLTLSLENSIIPPMNSEVTELDYGNSKTYVTGKVAAEDMTATYKNFIGKDIEKMLVDWRALVYNPKDDAIGFAADYKKKGFFLEFAPDGSRKREWEIQGIWPQAISWGNYDMTAGSDKILIEVTFKIDKAFRTDFKVGAKFNK